MTKPLSAFRPAYVVGIGLHPYQRMTETPYPVLGLAAVREALLDARIDWPAVESVYHGTALLGMASTRVMLRHLGGTGIPMQQVENASASGSTAFRLAASKWRPAYRDVALAARRRQAERRGRWPVRKRAFAASKAAASCRSRTSRCSRSATSSGTTHRPRRFARVAVKNHGNGAHNPYAQRQQARTLTTC